ncbi:MAG TPA: S9 family peptidase [Methylocella sp.]|nr:S9 family peptidase [Methylocella sp.]
MSKTIVPYGAWVSPVTTRLMTEAAIGLGSLSVDGSDLYWLEARPWEAGRVALCRRSPDGRIEDVTPHTHNVGSRVHEYGGGAYVARNGRILFSERTDGSVFLIEPAHPPRRIATPEGARYADFEFDPHHPRALAVREDHRGQPPTQPKAALIALSLGSSEAETILAEGHDFYSSPRFSPDGQKLCWLAWDHPDMPWDGTRLFLAKVTSEGAIGAVRLIAGETRQAIVQPEFSPDGTLHFCSDISGWWNLYAWRNGKIEALAPVEAEIGGPHWVFRQRYYDFLSDGRIVVSIVRSGIRTAALITNGKISPLAIGQVQDSPRAFGRGLAFISAPADAPPAIAVTPETEAGVPDRLREAAPVVLPQESISVGEPLEFPTQGGNAYGFWYAPKNRDYEGPPTSLPPLVVLSHGGPTSMTTNSFSLGIQWWTTRGFAVIDVNYGGSTGYGRPYRERLAGLWGIVDVEDCTAAAQYLIAQKRVDGERLIIRGGSAGGFTTLAVLTSKPIFKAGASFYGVADLLLLARDTHKFESRYLDRLIGPLPQSEALYRARSPIEHVDRLACPVIFFQGEDDRTVPPNQAEAMVAALKARGLPVAYYAFAGEGHGFRKAETLRRTLELELDFYGRVFGFTPPGLEEGVTIVNPRDRATDA